MQFLKKLHLILFVTLLTTQNAAACTIFIANDGKNVWVGNNEDDNPNKNYRFWFEPSKDKTKKGYIIWAGLLKGLAKGISDKFPEGGINESGLFIDAAVLPQKILIKKQAAKKDWKGYVIKAVLEKCKSVQEALDFLNQYNLTEQEKAQIFIADASGDYAIVHANYVIKKETNNFALTNYGLKDENQSLCWRRSIVDAMLKAKNEYDLNYIQTILEKSAQTDYFNKTNYSIAADLKQVQLYLYQKNDFTTSKVLSVKEALAKGKRSEDMTAFFPKKLSIELGKTLQKKGLDASLEQYKTLKNTASKDYNFNNNDMVDFAVQLIGQGKTIDAKAFLKLTTEFQPNHQTAQLWFAVASKLEQNDSKTVDLFTKLLEKYPKDYLIQLLGHQDSKITFKLDAFEDAKTVYLVGDFTEWKTKAVPMKKENGLWFCSVEIPKGAHAYKFIVDDVWVTDPKNGLTMHDKQYVNSKLMVW
jgi:Glycogen recognition site of AMP-activated protein kinase/Acyl-coenzyme A:6-aminopenicillanic acid acyl-transferase